MKPDFSISILLLAVQCAFENEPLLALLKAQNYDVECLCLSSKKNVLPLNILVEGKDLIILDTRDAHEKILELLAYLRRKSEAPVVILSGKNCEHARVESFECGADDYIVKPYSHAEVILRIGAILKRSLNHFCNEAVDCLQVEGLSLDQIRQLVWVEGKQVSVTPLEFRILWLLVFYRGKVLSKYYTYQSVLGREYGTFDRSIDMHLSRIRKKLTKAGFTADRLRTVRGRGYSFN